MSSSRQQQQQHLRAEPRHCAFCWDALVAHLGGVSAPSPDFDDAKCALFVTWTKAGAWGGRSGGQLRGCIGTLEPRRLHTALKDYALTSALRDSRFAPVELREVSRLSCSVSLLSCFEDAADWQDWVVGRHGLIVEFTDPAMQCKRSATFLPEVAADQGWSTRECIEALVRKAGYAGRPSEELLASLKVRRYQSSKASLSFADWQAAGSRLAGLEQLLAASSRRASQEQVVFA